MTRFAVVGSRGFPSRQQVENVLAQLVGPEDTVVSGGARGVDSWAVEWAEAQGIATKVFPADWSQGRGAGFARNATIVANADEVVAFWDGKSRGTADTIRKARAASKKLTIVERP